MTATFKKTLRRRLDSMEEELLQSIDDQRREYQQLTTGDRTEETDEASIRNEERALSTVLRHEERQLLRVQSAIARMEEGHYGICAVCGGEIDKKRLEARPEALFCYSCAQKRERSASQAHTN